MDVRVAAIILLLIATTLVGAWFYWVNCPLYAFQEAALAFQHHDEAAFNRRVDVNNLIDHFIEDLLVEPAMSTPNLSMFQQSVASGALTMAKSSVTSSLLESLHKSLNPEISRLPRFDWGMQPAYALEESTGSSLKNLMQSAGNEMSAEVKKLKTTAYQRMLTYIQNHPRSVPGKLLDCPPDGASRSAHLKELLTEYGLSVQTFRRLSGLSSAADVLGAEAARAGFTFYSPKIAAEITIDVELVKNLTTKEWRVSRLSNISQVMDTLEPDYRRDIHELVEYSLYGMNNKNMAADMNGITDRLKKDPSTRNLLNKLNLRF